MRVLTPHRLLRVLRLLAPPPSVYILLRTVIDHMSFFLSYRKNILSCKFLSLTRIDAHRFLPKRQNNEALEAFPTGGKMCCAFLRIFRIFCAFSPFFRIIAFFHFPSLDAFYQDLLIEFNEIEDLLTQSAEPQCYSQLSFRIRRQ